ncbi:MAG: hypothetical protein ACREID_01610 [Planctomycetota bacterium]
MTRVLLLLAAAGCAGGSYRVEGPGGGRYGFPCSRLERDDRGWRLEMWGNPADPVRVELVLPEAIEEGGSYFVGAGGCAFRAGRGFGPASHGFCGRVTVDRWTPSPASIEGRYWCQTEHGVAHGGFRARGR